jgi:glycosyltransferase involved in cell wall biosynthesis
LQVVRCGLDRSFFPEQLDAPPANAQLVCVGRLTEQKGQLLLLDAVAEVRRRGHAMQLVLAGDGELRPEIESRIAALGLREAVRITGWIDSAAVAKLIRASRALILPSFAEGLPVVLMEALALGRPVISTYVAGIPELVIPQENGWLVPAGDVASLADSIEELLSTPVDQLATMGRQGRARAQAMHDIHTQAGLLAGHFISCLEEPRPSLVAPA